MPRSIKPKMSRDELVDFDATIHSINYFDGEAVLVIGVWPDSNEVEIYLSEKDCEDIIQFIRRNKL